MYINRTQSASKIYKIENRIFCIKLQSNDNNINRNRARYPQRQSDDFFAIHLEEIERDIHKEQIEPIKRIATEQAGRQAGECMNESNMW